MKLHALRSKILHRPILVCTLGGCLTVYHADARGCWVGRDNCTLVTWGDAGAGWMDACWRSGIGVGVEGEGEGEGALDVDVDVDVGGSD